MSNLGVGLVLGNDLAGGKFFFIADVETPEPPIKFDVAGLFPSVFPACAVICAQSWKFKDIVNLVWIIYEFLSRIGGM